MAGTIEKFNEQVGRIEELIAAVKAMGFGEGDVTFEGETKASLQKRFQELLDAALLTTGMWQTTAQGVGQGVAGTASLVAGSGGANGTFSLGFSGGTQVIAPEGYFVVAAGVVTEVVITYAGHYSSGTPTLSFVSSAGLVGASATVVMAANTPLGKFFIVPSSEEHEYVILYKNNAGVAQEQGRFPSSQAAIDALAAAATAIEQAGVATTQAGLAEASALRVDLGALDDAVEDSEAAAASAAADKLAAAASAAIAAAAVSGSVNTFFAATKSAADSLAASLGNGATVQTDEDETATPAGVLTRRTVFDGVLSTVVKFFTTSMVAWKHSGTGAVWRTLYSRIMDLPVSVFDYMTDAERIDAMTASPILDHSASIQKALDTQQPLDWGNYNYRIASALIKTYTKPCIWKSNGATLTYAGAHREYAVALSGASVFFDIGRLTIDGGKLCNKPMQVLNNTTMATASRFISNDLRVKRAKRSNAFNGGDGLFIQGAFDSVDINGGGASDCELPPGQGTSGSIGICGITVTHSGIDAYARRCTAMGVNIEKIYSSDLDYTDDQDGIKFFAPHIASAGAFVETTFIVGGGSSFKNCYGRSVKSQAFSNFVDDSYFERTEGLTRGYGNGEIDCQVAAGSGRNLIFSYKNGQEPTFCMGVSSDVGYGAPNLNARDCEVRMDAATTLTSFARTYPRAGVFSRHIADNIKIFGKVKEPFNFLCNGNRNFIVVTNSYADEIVNGFMGDKALIYTRTSGVTTPFFANITAHGNVYSGLDQPALVRDGITSVAINSCVSSYNNFGFADVVSETMNNSGHKKTQIARLGKIGPKHEATDVGRFSGYFEPISRSVAAGATEVFAVRNLQGALLIINAAFNNTAYAMISSSASANTVISKGAPFEVGSTSEPATGTFRVWSSGTNEISIKNTDVTNRYVSVFVFCPA